ncbi:hypothetical protein LVJ94_10180 [Pendulispora rubella]|uniref:Uncharacterized protein n=1 Tax=Pendulispora rubella TaxID=2741070 RepID=A0ABZ2L9I9_9BACT
MTQRDPQRDKVDGVDGSRAVEESDDAEPKKERVLHTRVPAVLERELKRFADNLRVPVSNLVRTILEDALNVADAATENVESRLRNAAKQLEHERERLKARVKFDPLKDVFAFQTITLAQDATCAKCERDLAAGVRANLGLTDEPTNGKKKARIFVCDECLPGAR